MKFYNFHLMPYADVDLRAIEDHGTSWITFSNKHYDPEKGAQLYNDYLDQLEYSDARGFDGVIVNEHHQTPYGMMPVPAVLAGALARSVKGGKIVVLGRALPLVNNPLTIAEEYAIIDNISRGRLIAGFVRGIGAEYHTMGVNPTHSQERFIEAHDLILRAWTEPGPFEHAGKHFHFRYVNPWPLPYQKPHPPIWIPSQGSSDTIQWTAKMKYTYCQTFSPRNVVTRFFDMYRQQAEENGYQAGDEQLGWAFPIYIGENDKKARDEAKPHVEAMFNGLLNMPIDALLPPGYTSTESLKRIRAAKVVGQKKTIDELMEAGVVLIGGPETVRQKLAEYKEQVGFDNALLMTQCGTMPNAMARANIDAIAEEILPHLQSK